MATIKSFDFSSRSGGKGSYDWDTLGDGRIHVLIKGVDYDATVKYKVNGVKVAFEGKGYDPKLVNKRKVTGSETGDLAKVLKGQAIGTEYIVLQAVKLGAKPVAPKAEKAPRKAPVKRVKALPEGVPSELMGATVQAV